MSDSEKREAVLGIQNDEGPVCPWCRTLTPPAGSIEERIRTCQSCNRVFLFKVVVTKTWVSRPKESTP